MKPITHEENATLQPVAFVKEFFGASVATPESWTAFDAYFNGKAIWENEGVAKTVCPADAANFARVFPVKRKRPAGVPGVRY